MSISIWFIRWLIRSSMACCFTESLPKNSPRLLITSQSWAELGSASAGSIMANWLSWSTAAQ